MLVNVAHQGLVGDKFGPKFSQNPCNWGSKLVSRNSLLSRQTLYSKEFTKSDKIDDKIQDIDENIPNIDDSEAIRDLKSIGESKTLLKLWH